MDWEIHSDAIEEFRNLQDEHREIVEERIESRKKRKNSILDQRNVGLAYDSHGDPVHYFKIELENQSYRVFFDISDEKVVLLGIRERNDDTYIDLRSYTRRE